MTVNRTSPPRLQPGDPRYDDLAARGNARFAGRPEVIRPVGTTAEVVVAVQEAVDAGHRIAVRSGGHNLENFVDHPQVHTVIDMSSMTVVAYDDDRSAFMIEPGVTLGEAYRDLAQGWGVTLPAGLYPGVGIGGHVAGGGYGYLSRLHGLAVDHLYGVEVVVVGDGGHAHAVIATRETDDPNRALWWAHTGGGGGTFGVVTRYWFRTPSAAGPAGKVPASDSGATSPDQLLPAAPHSALQFSIAWNWGDMDEHSFTRLVRNHGAWAEQESGPDSAYAAMHSEFYLWRRPFGTITLDGVFAAADGQGRDQLDERLAEHLDSLQAGTGLEPSVTADWVPWLEVYAPDGAPGWGDFRMKVKDAYARRRLDEDQIATLYRHLTRTDTGAVGAALSVHTYGGAINDVAPDATAIAQRDSVLKLVPIAGWAGDGEGEEEHLSFLRELYRDLFAGTGGVPVPSERTDGAYLNHPDLDLADPQWNTSGVAWQELNHRDNYPRLQRVKADWDPRGVFHHEFSVRPG